MPGKGEGRLKAGTGCFIYLCAVYQTYSLPPSLLAYINLAVITHIRRKEMSPQQTCTTNQIFKVVIKYPRIWDSDSESITVREQQ